MQDWGAAIGDMQVAHLDSRAGARHALRFRLHDPSLHAALILPEWICSSIPRPAWNKRNDP
ncbi:hypothetical protein GCM10007857_04870 [Bradyrhizobium iriomotense]|uniref:Uncharacterized protein n=1 Tax=Bradyrhizobium iriomotense TaxID=441950 RepID=A0ABQ6AV74_9BRAD|nr:hypothetical protein GCM10007857_04870 [Bradyrhizobium iriomotense]